MNVKNPDPFKDSIILPVGATILFLYNKSLQRFSDPEQLHHCFLFNNNINIRRKKTKGELINF
jgi:hypothetical protein